ncbi:MAG: protein kinase, partial [Clostridiaceae bacterium]|nr:protein kinase [Clostridiaceae bacterium]
MIKITGYNIEQLIYKGLHSTFYRATRISDNIKVIVKVLNSEYPTLEELENIKREYRITNKPYGDKVIKVYGIENYKNSICIILEDFGAISLSELINTRKIDLNKKLSIAADIADAVWSIHKQGVIHKDVNPYNIVINFETNELKIIDFGISTDLYSEKLQ